MGLIQRIRGDESTGTVIEGITDFGWINRWGQEGSEGWNKGFRRGRKVGIRGLGRGVRRVGGLV